ncbi:FemAB family XrtA/PEP-CTERM system-associated protein [Duganella sp. P38]|uniref:FemAB family XrtA/PEP-CTERM system-associated protein n=1 Tax=Duganella sp. P38 TaxID=3423949 RepID=UPI003D7AA610
MSTALAPETARAATTAALRLRLLDAQDQRRWDAFVAQCPEATFFHRAGWQRVLEQGMGHRTWFYYVEQDGAIVGVLPLCRVRSRLFGDWLGALPFCVYGGVAAATPAARALLDQAAQALAAELGVGHLEYRSVQASHPGDPSWHVKPLYATFRKAIVADNEANMNAIPRKQRAMVRKGIKFGLKGEIDQDIGRFYHAYASSVHRLGTPVFSRRYFALLKQEFGDDCELRVITHEGKTVAAVMSFFFRDQVLPYYGGGTDDARALAANDFMYWDLMQDCATRGCRLFDFGRSKLGTGAFDFKKNWGFEPELLGYEYQLHAAPAVPENNPLNPKYRLFIRLWQRLPLPVANLVGPLIVKNLG